MWSSSGTAPHLKGHAVATEFKLPELGENIESGDVVRVAVAKGDRVSEGQAVIELETDKAVIEVPSSVSGVVQEIKVKQGQKVKVGEVLFTLEGNGTGTKPAPSERLRNRKRRPLQKSSRPRNP